MQHNRMRTVAAGAGAAALMGMTLAGPALAAEPPSRELVEFVGGCVDALRLNGFDAWWQPSPETRAMLAGLVPVD